MRLVNSWAEEGVRKVESETSKRRSPGLDSPSLVAQTRLLSTMSGPPPGLMRKKAMGDGDKASTIKVVFASV